MYSMSDIDVPSRSIRYPANLVSGIVNVTVISSMPVLIVRVFPEPEG